MPNKSFIIQYLIKAREDFAAAASRVKKSMRGTDRAVKDADKSFKKANKSSRAFAKGLKQLLAASLVVVGIRKLIEVGTKFQDSMADLSAITGASGRDLDDLKGKVFAMSRQYVVSQADVAQAIKLVASAKPELLDNIDLLSKTTEAVLLLKNASGIELAEAARITAESLNQFGADASRASEFVNLLAAGAKFGSSEIAQTGAAATIAGPAAKAAGLDFLQLNAAIQTVAKGGIKAEKAGTALNSILGRMRRQGIDFTKLGLQGAFEVVKKAIDGTTDSTARALLEAKIFGEEHAKVGLALIDNVKFLGEYERKLLGTNVAQEQAGIRMKTFSTTMRKVGIIMDEKIIKVFGRAQKSTNFLAGTIQRFMGGLDPSDLEAFALVLSALAVIAAGVGEVFSVAFRVIMTVVKPVLALLKGIATVIGQIAAAILTLDFSQFDLAGAFSIGGKVLGLFGEGDKEAKTAGLFAEGGGEIKAEPLLAQTRVDVGVNVGLDQGLKQTGAASVAGPGARRADVGVVAQ